MLPSMSMISEWDMFWMFLESSLDSPSSFKLISVQFSSLLTLLSSMVISLFEPRWLVSDELTELMSSTESVL
jgi:hypothetical protein